MTRGGRRGSEFFTEGEDLSTELLIVGAELLNVGLLLLVKLKKELLLVGHDEGKRKKNRDLM